MGPKDRSQCFCMMGIMVAVAGFIFGYWFMIILGGFFVFLGICSMSQGSKKKPQPSASPQPVTQPAPQPAPQPTIVEQPPETHRFCPHCGASTAGKFCSECGSQID